MKIHYNIGYLLRTLDSGQAPERPNTRGGGGLVATPIATKAAEAEPLFESQPVGQLMNIVWYILPGGASTVNKRCFEFEVSETKMMRDVGLPGIIIMHRSVQGKEFLDFLEFKERVYLGCLYTTPQNQSIREMRVEKPIIDKFQCICVEKIFTFIQSV